MTPKETSNTIVIVFLSFLIGIGITAIVYSNSRTCGKALDYDECEEVCIGWEEKLEQYCHKKEILLSGLDGDTCESCIKIENDTFIMSNRCKPLIDNIFEAGGVCFNRTSGKDVAFIGIVTGSKVTSLEEICSYEPVKTGDCLQTELRCK